MSSRSNLMRLALVLAVVVTWNMAAQGQEGTEVVKADENVVFFDDFSEGMDNWWSEGGVRVWVEDERLHVDAEPGGTRSDRRPGLCATVWCKQQFDGDVKIECDAHVLRSDIDVNNINFFIHFSDPGGAALYDTRDLRPEAGYGHYHQMTGNIITFLSDVGEESMKMPASERPARIRIRHCPGFELLAEEFTHHCRKQRTYHITITKRGGQLSFDVDGKTLLETEDPAPPAGGLFGLRTFRTYLWWDNVKVTGL
jgi:hypothetical protein